MKIDVDTSETTTSAITFIIKPYTILYGTSTVSLTDQTSVISLTITATSLTPSVDVANVITATQNVMLDTVGT